MFHKARTFTVVVSLILLVALLLTACVPAAKAPATNKLEMFSWWTPRRYSPPG